MISHDFPIFHGSSVPLRTPIGTIQLIHGMLWWSFLAHQRVSLWSLPKGSRCWLALWGTPWIGNPDITSMNHGKSQILANKFTNCQLFLLKTSFVFETGNCPKPVWTPRAFQHRVMMPFPRLCRLTPVRRASYSVGPLEISKEVVQTSTFLWVFIMSFFWIGPTSLWVQRSIMYLRPLGMRDVDEFWSIFDSSWCGHQGCWNETRPGEDMETWGSNGRDWSWWL